MTGKACRQRREERRAALQWTQDQALAHTEAKVEVPQAEANQTVSEPPRRRKTVQFEPEALEALVEPEDVEEAEQEEEPAFVVVVRNTFLDFGMPKEERTHRRRRSEPFGLRSEPADLDAMGKSLSDMPVRQEVDAQPALSPANPCYYMGAPAYYANGLAAGATHCPGIPAGVIADTEPCRIRIVSEFGTEQADEDALDSYADEEFEQRQRLRTRSFTAAISEMTHEDPAFLIIRSEADEDDEEFAQRQRLRTRSFTAPIQPEMTTEDPAFLVVRSEFFNTDKSIDNEWETDTASLCSSERLDSTCSSDSSQPTASWSFPQYQGADINVKNTFLNMSEPKVERKRSKTDVFSEEAFIREG